MRFNWKIFIAVEVFCASLAWLSGYDFDTRGFVVTYGVLCSVAFGVWVAALPTLGG